MDGHTLKESLCKQLKHEKMNNDIVHLKADTLFITTSVLQSNLKNIAKMCFAVVSSKANFIPSKFSKSSLAKCTTRAKDEKSPFGVPAPLMND